MNNEELIRKLYRAFSNRDLGSLNQICDEDILWTQNPGFPGGGVSLGVSKIIENVYVGNTSRWKEFQFIVESLTTTKDTVLVEGHYVVQGKGARDQVSAQTAHVFKIRNQKVVSFQQYTDSKTLWDNYNQ